MNKTTIYHYHGPIHLEYASKVARKNICKYYMLWFLQKLTIMFSDKILFHSEYMKNIAIKEHKISTKKCHYLPPYIDIREDFIIKNNELVIDHLKTNILIPRRLTARTGVVEFLRAFNSLYIDTESPYTIYVTGVGELQKEVEELALHNPINVKYLGFVTYEQLWALYSEMTCVAVPTIDLEGFGYVILEALSCGAGAIVSTSCGGGYDFVKNNLGNEYCFDINNIDSIHKTLDFIASSSMKRNEYKSIANKFTTEKMLDIYIHKILKK